MMSGDYPDEYTRVLCAIMEGMIEGVDWDGLEHCLGQNIWELKLQMKITKTEIEAMRAREKEMEEREK
ncbi:hypothetical protein Taro_051900, partial [Colocasia esculenta]|nr:hypothetical protein [Colocasia esculenta]